MKGPKPRGTWSAQGKPKWGPFVAGQRYRVIRGFRDLDGALHPVGEEWTFWAECSYFRDPDRWLVVSFDGVQEWSIPLLDAPGQQGEIIRDPAAYVQALA